MIPRCPILFWVRLIQPTWSIFQPGGRGRLNTSQSFLGSSWLTRKLGALGNPTTSHVSGQRSPKRQSFQLFQESPLVYRVPSTRRETQQIVISRSQVGLIRASLVQDRACPPSDSSTVDTASKHRLSLHTHSILQTQALVCDRNHCQALHFHSPYLQDVAQEVI